MDNHRSVPKDTTKLLTFLRQHRLAVSAEDLDS